MAFLKVILVIVLAFVSIPEAISSAQPSNEQNALHDNPIPRQVIGPNTKLNHAPRNNEDASSSGQHRNVKDDTILSLKRQNVGLKTKLQQSLRDNQAYIQAALEAANHPPTSRTNWTANQALVSGNPFWVHDCVITVSTIYSSPYEGYCGRINATINPTCHASASWIPRTAVADPWIEATFLPFARFVVTSITTRGTPGSSAFVTQYRLGFRIDVDIVPYFDERGNYKTFLRHLVGEITHDLDPFIVYARSVILFPVAWNTAGGVLFYFAWEIHGYPMIE